MRYNPLFISKEESHWSNLKTVTSRRKISK